MSKSGFKFSTRSLKNMEGIQPDLVRVLHRALEITEVDIVVIDGLRTTEEQSELVRRGASKTMNSRHLTGHAADIVPFIGGRIRWDWPPFYKLAEAMKAAASEFGVDLEWGGDWRSFKDGPHFQLSWASYPA